MADVAQREQTERITHVLVTFDDRYGLSAESPQIPGWFYGRPTKTEFARDYRRVLQDARVLGPVLAHHQVRRVTDDGQEYVLRCTEDAQSADRAEVIRRLELLLGTDQAADMLDTEKNPLGEVVFVAALPADPLSMYIDQMYDDGDALVICGSVVDNGVFSTAMASGRGELPGWESLEEQGWTRETTVSELITAWASGRRSRLLV